MAIQVKMRRPLLDGQEPKASSPWTVILVVVIVIAAAAGAWYWFKVRPASSDAITGLTEGDKTIMSATGYQAVFLDNGQVYFGKLEARSSKFEGLIRLSDVYYLQYKQGLQSGDIAAPEANVSLLKLGSEVHGPEDHMDLNTEHILFIEDLKADSKVASAIADYVAKKKSN